MTRARARLLLAIVCLLGLGAGAFATQAGAVGPPGAATWRLEQPLPPDPPVEPTEVPASETPIGLGLVGDMQFVAPNRGLLITPGNGNTIPPGVWAYNGAGWHLLSSVCGATDGRIAWAGPEEFWTVSDGRPGQAKNPRTGLPAPLEDNTLCHFAHGEVAGSYAAPAFQANSYQPMHAAGCISASDCWFAGEPLPEPQNGEAFHLHWGGSALTAEPSLQGHAVEDLRTFEGRLYESLRISPQDATPVAFEALPSALHVINPAGISPTFEPVLGAPLYSSQEFPEALEALHLGADADGLWAAAGPVEEPPTGSSPAGLTVLRNTGGSRRQVLGPEAEAPSSIKEDVVESIAPEPGSENSWIALGPRDDEEKKSPTVPALLAHVGSDGGVETQTLPSAAEAAEGVGPKGAAKAVSCPAAEDCWLVTTQGWLFHLAPAGREKLAADEVDRSAVFANRITFRPPDAGLPQVVPDAPPPDDSGLGERPVGKGLLVEIPTTPEAKVRAPLVTSVHSRLVHGTTLELRFHLAVEARVKLLAKRKQRVVASTSSHTFAAGNRKLLLRLNRNRWPTKLDLQAHALAALPLESTRLPGNNTVGTGVVVLPGRHAAPAAPSLIAPFEGSLP
jgi:hypothetical protein